MFIDTHVHLTDAYYKDKFETVRANYLNSGVGKVISVGYDLNSSKKGKELAEKYSEIYFSVGIHPSDADKLNSDALEELKILARHKKCVAIGEIGLDYHYEGYDKTIQAKAFQTQLQLAYEVGLPTIIHTRDACFDTVKILKDNKSLLDNGFLMHCFSESKETAKELALLGAYFTFGGAITFKNAKKQEIIKSIPFSKLLAETDCPYLTPVPHRGEKNEPKNVIYVYEYIANTLGISVENLKAEFKKNSATLFKKLK